MKRNDVLHYMYGFVCAKIDINNEARANPLSRKEVHPWFLAGKFMAYNTVLQELKELIKAEEEKLAKMEAKEHV